MGIRLAGLRLGSWTAPVADPSNHQEQPAQIMAQSVLTE